MEVHAEQRQVADHVEDLVPGALVGVTKRVADHAIAAEDQEIGRRWSGCRSRAARRALASASSRNVRLAASSSRNASGVRSTQIALSGDRCIAAVIEMVGECQTVRHARDGGQCRAPLAHADRRSSTRACRVRSCSTIPAWSNASTKARLEPSHPGHSRASISIEAIVDPRDPPVRPSRARSSPPTPHPCWIVVRRWDGMTLSMRAGTAGRPGRSVRTKTMPVPAFGRMEPSNDIDPWKNPTPRTSVVRASVRSERVARSIPLPFHRIADRRVAARSARQILANDRGLPLNQAGPERPRPRGVDVPPTGLDSTGWKERKISIAGDIQARLRLFHLQAVPRHRCSPPGELAPRRRRRAFGAGRATVAL